MFYDPTETALSSLKLTWEHPPDPSYDYLQFLKKNHSDSLFCLASSTPYPDLVTEIWNSTEHTKLKRIDTPNTQVCCMDWLRDDSFVTGGHDNMLTLWREGERVVQ